MRSGILRALFFTLGMLTFVAAGHAHPMGNFSVNHYTRITIQNDALRLEYFIDLAEIPTYQEFKDEGIQADDQGPKLSAYLQKKAAALLQGLMVEVDGKRVVLRTLHSNAIFPPGAGGLPTMKLGFVYEAALTGSSAEPRALHYIDGNYAGRAGWKEVVAGVGTGASLIQSSVPSHDRSTQLSNYPTDMLNSPPQDLEASLTFAIRAATPTPASAPAPKIVALPAKAPASASKRASGVTPVAVAAKAARPSLRTPPAITPPSVAAPAPTAPVSSASDSVRLSANRQATPRNAFTELITRQHLSFWFLLTAALIAMALGALHAVEPGHGKTLVAAYLVGSRGKARHAVILGMIVTLAHTAGVFLLGLITLYASRYIVPEKIYPWLGVVSGISITGLAFLMLLRRLAEGRSAEGHLHWYEKFAKTRAVLTPQESTRDGAVPLRQLLLLGITGGLIPCPAALVVLLSALSLHRIGFGLFLIVCFSLGLAAVLVGIGLAMVYAGRVMKSRFKYEGRLLTRGLPVLSAAFMIFLGLALTFQSLGTTGIQLHITQIFNTHFIVLLVVGVILGMRHSTDPDHLAAVTTIVTRLRSVRQASLIGLLWGVGHTFTIFLVGSAIILFGVAIPPRIGLSMEFGVALMLILLGLLNLSGVMKRITSRFTKPGFGQIEPAIATISAAGLDGVPRGQGLRGLCGEFGRYHLLRPLIIGTVHGLAGSAAIALLVLATIKNPLWAIAYLLLFGGGTMIGMCLMTMLVSLPIIWSGRRMHTRIPHFMGIASGVVSLAFGMVLVYQIGYIDGLFRTTVNWNPH